METQVITIPVRSDIDPSQLLDIAIEMAESLISEIESYGCEAEVDEADICVSDAE